MLVYKKIYMTRKKQVLMIAYNKLDNFGSSIIHKSKLYDILKVIILEYSNINIMIDNLKKQNKIKYVFEDYFYILNSDEQVKGYVKYSINEIVFLILNKLKIDWHIGLYSALLINNVECKYDLFHQIPTTTIIINSKYSKTIQILNQKYIFKKQQNYRLIGIKKKITKNRITFYYSDIERTYLEYIYYTHSSNIDQNTLNINKINEYLQYFPKTLSNRVLNGAFTNE